MLINLLLMLFLIWFIIHNFIKAHTFTSFSVWHDSFIPIYSLVLFFITMKWDRANLILLAILTPVALLLGWYETRGIEIKKEKSHKNKTEYEYMIKRGTPYAVGWTLTFVLGIALHAWFAKEKILNMFSEAIWDNLIEELNPFAIFFTSHTWYIWLLSGLSSITFISVIKYSISRYLKHKKEETL